MSTEIAPQHTVGTVPASAGNTEIPSTAAAVALGMLVMLAGTIPRNIFFATNLRLWSSVPWAVPVTAAYLWLFWRYVRGDGAPVSTRDIRRALLRDRPRRHRVWVWSLVAGGLGVVALVLALRLASAAIALPAQELPDLSAVPRVTVWALLLMAAPVAGVVEEGAFRGYMQGPIERRLGITAAILITGTMFAIAHLDFTWMLWPYYVAVSLVYGLVAHLTRSVRPAVVLHTAGNIYSNVDLLLHGRAEWQTLPGRAAGMAAFDASFLQTAASLAVVAIGAVWAYGRLASVTGQDREMM